MNHTVVAVVVKCICILFKDNQVLFLCIFPCTRKKDNLKRGGNSSKSITVTKYNTAVYTSQGTGLIQEGLKKVRKTYLHIFFKLTVTISLIKSYTCKIH